MTEKNNRGFTLCTLVGQSWISVLEEKRKKQSLKCDLIHIYK